MATLPTTISTTAEIFAQFQNVGPFIDGNDNLYVVLRNGTNQYELEMWKSDDGGDTWAVVDAAGQPNAGSGTDIAIGIDVVQDGTMLHVACMNDNENLYYNSFTTSDDGTTPDEWVTVDKLVVDYTDNAFEWSATIAVQSDGDIIIFSNGDDGTYYAGRECVEYHFSDDGGATWDTKNSFGATDSDNLVGPTCIGENDKIHAVWKEEAADRWNHRSLVNIDSAPSASEGLDGSGTYDECDFNYSSAHKLVYYDDDGVERITFVALDNTGVNDTPWSTIVEDDGTPDTPEQVTTTAVWRGSSNSHSAAMTLCVDQAEKTVYCIFADKTTQDIYVIKNINDGGWTGETEIWDAVTCDLLSANLYVNPDGAKVIGFIIDDGGPSGSIIYNEYILNPGYSQNFFQIRSGDTEGLNSDTGWAAAENTNAAIGTGILFRIRFKVQRVGVGTASQFKPQIKFNATAWIDAAIMLDAVSAPCVFVKESSQYADTDPTSTELLTNRGTYVSGEGVEGVRELGNILTTSIDLDDQEAEFEYTFQILAMMADPSRDEVEAGDTIEFRLVESDGTVFPNAYANPVITVVETPGYIGLTSIENPNRTVYFEDDNDDLYVFGEDIDNISTSPFQVAMKSSDGGLTWAWVDDAGKSTSNFDYEAGDMQVVDDIAYMIGIDNDDPYHMQFNFSGAAANPDEWVVTGEDEVIKTAVVRDDQCAAIVRRSDNTMIAFFQEAPSDINITYRIKDGTWGADNDLDPEAATNFTMVSVILGASFTHIFYVDLTNGYLYHNTIAHSDDQLGTREIVHNDIGVGSDDFNLIQPILYDPAGGVAERVVVAFRNDANDLLYTSKIDDNGSPSAPVAASDNTVAYGEIGANKPHASLVVFGTDLYLVYSDETNHEIWLTKSDDYGSWDTDTKIVSSILAHSIEAVAYEPSGGGRYLGIFYDIDSDGGQGQMWFTAYELEGPLVDKLQPRVQVKRSVQIPIAHLSI